MDSPRKAAAESDIRLADSDIHAGRAAESRGEGPPAKNKDEVDRKVSEFEELDLTLDQDV